MRSSIGHLFCLAIGLLAGTADAQPPAPDVFLKRPIGSDFQLANWQQVSRYYQELAKNSPNVLLQSAGKTTEGREFLYAIISAAENLRRLDELKSFAATIADPRGKSPEELRQAVTQGKVILFVTPTMHADEPAATEMGMQFAFLLATSEAEPWVSARRHAVVVITPSLNPDGVDHVSNWVAAHVGTPYESADLLKLYQFYTGHDNNRDWFMLTQVETRHLTRLMYQEFHPQFLWDVHQQGGTKERFFVPPYRDPLNPNLDSGIVAGINLIGTRAVMDLTRDGFTGVATGVSYDNWWNGGNRSVPARHNVIGILTEAASCRLASPVFWERDKLSDPLGRPNYQQSNQFIAPWPGGWWRLRDIIDYELAFGQSMLGSISREPQYWLTNSLQAAQRSIASTSGPQAWLIPNDNPDLHATRRLVDVLLASGVEIGVASEEFAADGRSYPAGTLVIRRNQPYGNYVKDLFERQQFPMGVQPYDVAGWTLPLLLGVRTVAVSQPIDVQTSLAHSADDSLGAFVGDRSENPDLLPVTDSRTWTKIAAALEADQQVVFLGEGHSSRPGQFVVTDDAGQWVDSEQLLKLTALPRIAIYCPWSESMDEGWLRWVFDEFKIPFVTVRNENLRAGDLNAAFDVLIIPDISPTKLEDGRPAGSIGAEYSGGLGTEGALAVEQFVSDGGKLVCLGGSSNWAAELFGLPIVDVTTGKEAKGFSCPGSILRGTFETDDGRLLAGLPADTPLFFAGSHAWRPMTAEEKKDADNDTNMPMPLLRYAKTRILLSGYIAEPEVIAGRSAWMRAGHGEGVVHLFGFRPHYRAWSEVTFGLLFRAVFLD